MPKRKIKQRKYGSFGQRKSPIRYALRKGKGFGKKR